MSRIDEIRERWAAAKPGPWSVNDHLADEDCIYVESERDGVATVFNVLHGERGPLATAHAIAHAPADIDYLLELLEVVKPHLYWLGEACQRANCSSPSDEIMAARAALQRLQEAL